MKFRIATSCDNGTAVERPVNWIKQFREETGCGLRESKCVCDAIRAISPDAPHPRFLVIDTKIQPEFAFLEDVPMETKMFRFSKSMPVSDANTVLKNTAVRLIRMGAISEARDVLKILM